MRVLGIDPGYNIVGFGVVESNGNQVIDYGVITTPKEMPMSERLLTIYKATLCKNTAESNWRRNLKKRKNRIENVISCSHCGKH